MKKFAAVKQIILNREKNRPVVVFTTRKNNSRHIVIEFDTVARELLFYNRISLGILGKLFIQDFRIKRFGKRLKMSS